MATTDLPVLGRKLVVISFPFPHKLISLNDRTHWSERARRVKEWREVAGWRAIEATRKLRLVLPLPPAVVLCKFFGAKQRDASNLMPTVKSCTDGLVDAGWWSDDDDVHVSQAEPIVQRDLGGFKLPTVGIGVFAR